jgi:hypothetical protein
MRREFNTPFNRELYIRWMGTFEPVFANVQNNGMRRFTLFTVVHNIEKVAGAAMR